jgi:Na+/melibiose symporter-like transporter
MIAALSLVKEPPIPPLPAHRLPLRAALATIVREPLLVRVLASDFAVTLGQSIRGALIVFFVSAYMHRPDLAAGLFLLQFVFGVFAGPIWLKIGYRLGKHRTVIAGELVQVAINLGLLAVTPSAMPLLIGLTVAQGLAQGSGNLMLRALVADIADKQRLETGEERTALFFSVFALAGKAATAVAVGVALPLVAYLGFQPGHANTPQALEGLKWVFALGPALAHIASAALISRFSLDEAQHGEIRRALAAQEALPNSAAAYPAAAE